MQGKKLYFCKVSTNDDEVSLDERTCKTGPWVWNPIGGFATKENFFLTCTNRSVIIFTTGGFDDRSGKKFTEVRYEDFFVCGASSKSVLVMSFEFGFDFTVSIFRVGSSWSHHCCTYLVVGGVLSVFSLLFFAKQNTRSVD